MRGGWGKPAARIIEDGGTTTGRFNVALRLVQCGTDALVLREALGTAHQRPPPSTRISFDPRHGRLPCDEVD